MIPLTGIVLMMTDSRAGDSFIADPVLTKSQDRIRPSESLTLSLAFKIDGIIREVFDQKNWERAYNKHDNVFRISFEIELKSGRKKILESKFVRKAPLFWTRNPKIPHRIWVSVVKDDMPFYPLAVDEAKALLFDVNKVIELDGSRLKRGTNKLYADIRVWWGRHAYTEPTKITAKSNEIEVSLIE